MTDSKHWSFNRSRPYLLSSPKMNSVSPTPPEIITEQPTSKSDQHDEKAIGLAELVKNFNFINISRNYKI